MFAMKRRELNNPDIEVRKKRAPFKQWKATSKTLFA